MRSDLAAHLEQMQRDVDRAREQISAAQEAIQALRVDASSDDGLVTVAVTATGGIAELTIDPRAMRHDSRTLAAAILDTIGRANAQLQEAMSAQYRDILGGTFDPQGLLRDPASAQEAIQEAARQLGEQRGR